MKIAISSEGKELDSNCSSMFGRCSYFIIAETNGENIKKIEEETDADVTIEDDGTTLIYAENQEMGEKAKQMVQKFVEEPEAGKIYRNCPIKRMEDYGAFVEFLPGITGLLHISEVEKQHTNNIYDVLSIGDEVDVLLKKISGPGKFELSIKDLKD